MTKSKKKLTNKQEWAIIIVFYLIAIILFFGSIDFDMGMNYEEANATWEEHVRILEGDLNFTNESINECEDYISISYCINNIYPILDVYSNHIKNARDFLEKEGDVFDNKQELLAYLDRHEIYIKIIRNNLEYELSRYN